MKLLFSILAFLMLTVLFLCVYLINVCDSDTHRMEVLVRDSIKCHHVIKRQNEMILDYKKNKDFRVLKEINN